MKIDLHTHSNASDGTDCPSQMPRLAYEAGLNVVGLTDHDTVDGWDAAAGTAKDLGVTLVRGMEMTAHIAVDPSEHPRGCNSMSVHILAYLFNPEHEDIRQHIMHMKTARNNRAREIVECLSEDYPISWELVQEYCQPGAPIGRPHIADALVSLGVGADRSDIFRRILMPGSRYYVSNPSPCASDTVQWIMNAGGKAVLAHPKAPRRGNVVPDRVLCELAELGLFGVEVNHRDNLPELRPALAELSEGLGLRQCGSSDYHGDGKPNRLGENLTSEQVYEALIDGAYLTVVEA